MRKLTLLVLCVAVFLAGEQGRAAQLHVAVFNFQMKSDTPQWKWVEKGLADQITTDFTRSKRLTVVARDEMQILARRLKWTPEMAMMRGTSMEQIRKHLKIDNLVTGIYSIADGQITITAQIIDVETRKERWRKVVSGKVSDVLSLQKRLSAELLGWFSGVPAEKILPHLPVWTTSIAATRGLYEGLHLYDEGRYAEAWLKFRQAVREDPTYLEAGYWVGRMYYFMDRYEHARRAYDRFIYMDATHPRVGDAIKEYVHTYEKLHVPPETLLKLYADLIELFPKVIIHNELEVEAPVTNRVWLRTRSAQVLGWLGRHKEAAQLAGAALKELQQKLQPWQWDGRAYDVTMANVMKHAQLTGEVVFPKGLLTHYYLGPGAKHTDLRFAPGSNEAVIISKTPERLAGVQLSTGETRYTPSFHWYFVLAPDGHYFKKLTFYPIIDGTDGKIGLDVHKDRLSDGGSSRRVSIAEACRGGLTVDNIPRTGILHMHCYVLPNSSSRDPKLVFRGMRGVAEFGKIDPRHGAVEIVGTNADQIFAKTADGRRIGNSAGLIGLLEPGEHRMILTAKGREFESHETTVNVKPGRTTRVVARMQWRANSPWADWSTGVLIGQDYPRKSPCLQADEGPPCIQADEKAIRVFWSHEGDLWLAKSTDGEKFSPPAKLSMPISTGWLEHEPICLRDESGRFLLAFSSDREARHHKRAYICWSRDTRHWSRPAMVVDRPIMHFDLVQDNRGQFLWADTSEKTITVMRSSDAYRWEILAKLTLEAEANCVRIVQRRNGSYELFATEDHFLTAERIANYGRTRTFRYISADAREWSKGQLLNTFSFVNSSGILNVTEADERIYFCQTSGDPRHTGGFVLQVFRERENGWDKSRNQQTVARTQTAMAYHRRWGHMLAWRLPPEAQFPIPAAGPFLIRGKSMDRLFAGKARRK